MRRRHWVMPCPLLVIMAACGPPRASGTTAMAMNIQEASEEDFGFSIGLTEGSRQRAFLPTDRKRFDLVMAALKSNALDNGGPGEACLVFERRVKEAPEEGDGAPTPGA